MARNDPVARIRAKALLDLERANRRLIPEDVVKAAESPTHVLHDAFEWDNSIAGHNWRLEQARVLIREVKVTTVIEDRIVVSPMYVSDVDPNRAQNGYVALSVASKLRDDSRRVLLDEFARIESSVKRAQAVAAVLGVGGDLDRMIAALVEARARLAA